MQQIVHASNPTQRLSHLFSQATAGIRKSLARLMSPGSTKPGLEFTTAARVEQERLLKAACDAICQRRFEDAEKSISEAARYAPLDCLAWNLLGLAHECRTQWKAARRCYGKAIAINGHFSPAQQNMRDCMNCTPSVAATSRSRWAWAVLPDASVQTICTWPVATLFFSASMTRRPMTASSAVMRRGRAPVRTHSTKYRSSASKPSPLAVSIVCVFPCW